MRKKELVYKQELLTIAIVVIVVGAIIWLGPWPVIAQPATNVVGQVIFWPGIALLIYWFILLAIYYGKNPK